jgi:glycine oxidase
VNSTAEVDLLIIGQGLAGSAVAMRALARNYLIRVIDQPSENHSSQVAAGLFNPVTGRKKVKTWLADDLFPELHRYYQGIEALAAKRFFYPAPIYRPFTGVEEQNEWMAKSVDPSYRDYIAEIHTGPLYGKKVNDPFGGIRLKQSGYLDTRTYLAAIRMHLEERGLLEKTCFHEQDLQIHGSFVRYQGLTARKIIFCQGAANKSNPWFSYLPINSLKGEFLTVQCHWEKDVILNRGVYMVPDADRMVWRVGATYNRSDQTPEITSWAKTELTGKLEDLIRIPYTITGQQWGFRPITPDRKPIIGAHPEYKSLIIFNGLGTKGVSLAPYFSEVLFRWMENRGMIGKEAAVTRF